MIYDMETAIREDRWHECCFYCLPFRRQTPEKTQPRTLLGSKGCKAMKSTSSVLKLSIAMLTSLVLSGALYAGPPKTTTSNKTIKTTGTPVNAFNKVGNTNNFNIVNNNNVVNNNVVNNNVVNNNVVNHNVVNNNFVNTRIGNLSSGSGKPFQGQRRQYPWWYTNCYTCYDSCGWYGVSVFYPVVVETLVIIPPADVPASPNSTSNAAPVSATQPVGTTGPMPQ